MPEQGHRPGGRHQEVRGVGGRPGDPQDRPTRDSDAQGRREITSLRHEGLLKKTLPVDRGGFGFNNCYDVEAYTVGRCYLS